MYSAAESQELEQNRVFCSVCLEDYDDEAHVPRFHSSEFCGHSMCHSCFMQIRFVDTRCTICRAEFCIALECNPINKPLKYICGRIKEIKLEKVYLTTAVNNLTKLIKERTEERDGKMEAHGIELPSHLRHNGAQVDHEPDPYNEDMMYQDEMSRFRLFIHGSDRDNTTNWQLKEAIGILCGLMFERDRLFSRKFRLEVNLDLVKEQCSIIEAEMLAASMKHMEICGGSFTSTAVPRCLQGICGAEENGGEEENEESGE